LIDEKENNRLNIKYNFIFSPGSFLPIKEEFDMVFIEDCLLSILGMKD
jgi:hypothetical protein